MDGPPTSGKADLVQGVRWEGPRAFEAYRLTIDDGTNVYEFIVPKACGNLSLASVTPVARVVAAAPPPPPPPPPSPPPPPPPVPAVSHALPFVEGLFGKQRRTREFTSAVDPRLLLHDGFCDPLFGVKGGVLFQISPGFALGPAVGVDIDVDKASWSGVFAELELNHTTKNGGYIGAGVGVWDVNQGDTRSGSLLAVHFGVPLKREASGRRGCFS